MPGAPYAHSRPCARVSPKRDLPTTTSLKVEREGSSPHRVPCATPTAHTINSVSNARAGEWLRPRNSSGLLLDLPSQAVPYLFALGAVA